MAINEDTHEQHKIRLDRREALTRIAWAGTGLLATLTAGIPRAGLLGEASAASADPLQYVSGSNNAILFDKCKSLHNLAVFLEVTGSMATLENNGFSLQLNCYPQTRPQATYQSIPLKWMQYVLQVYDNQIQWGIQYWSVATVPKGVPGFGYNPPNNYSSFGSVSSNQIPAGSVMSIELKTERNGSVSEAIFSVAIPGAQASTFKFAFPSNALCAINSFEVNLVGPGNGTHTCEFVSGDGLLTYSVNPGTLSETGILTYPAPTSGQNTNNACVNVQSVTTEKSNIWYGNVTPASGSRVSQRVFIPNLQLFYGVRGPGPVWTLLRGPNGLWSDHQNLGGSTDSNITAIVLPGSQQVQLFYVGKPSSYGGTESSVWTRWRKSDGSWSDQQNLGGSTNSYNRITAIVIPGTEIVQLFYVGTDGSVRTRWRESDGTWSPHHHNLGGSSISDITAIVLPGTEIVQLFYVGTDNSLRTLWREPGGKWSPHHQNLGGHTGGPGCNITAIVLPGTQIVQLFYAGSEFKVWTCWRNTDGKWSPHQHHVGGTANGNIAAIVVPGTQIVHLFYAGSGLAPSVWTCSHSNGKWSDQQNLGGSPYGLITAAVVPHWDNPGWSQTLQLFYVGPDGGVRTNWLKSDGRWSDEQHLRQAGGDEVFVRSDITAAIVPWLGY
jgi:hypothetical protein